MHQYPSPTTYTVNDIGTTITGGYALKEHLRIKGGDNSSCVWEGEHTGGFKRRDWGDRVIFERVSRSPVSRDLM